MITNRVGGIDRSVEKTHVWLDDLLGDEIGSDDRHYGYRVARIASEAHLAGKTEASIAASAANRGLRRRISAGDGSVLLHELAGDLRELLSPEAVLDDG